MLISRRAFTGGALSAALGSQLAAPALAQGSSRSAALAAIRAYGEAHIRHFGLPGMTLGMTAPDGFSTVMNFGFANRETRTPITADTLFQIGSISKSFTAALLHQFAAEGRFRLSDPIVALLPEAPLPKDSPIEVQHLLDHVAGIPGDAPLFVSGGLWTAYAPGAHWRYSNTGYELLGLLAQHVGGKPLDRLFTERLFMPLGMGRSRGAIVAADRLLYAQGYQAANDQVPYVRGNPLAPAAWVNTTTAAGSIASTAADMVYYLRTLASAAQGRGGMGLGPKEGLAYTGHSVPSDSPQMAYGNGLMHVSSGGRRYLHHTGGMVSFSSAFHVDTGNGVGAFASSSISAFAEYRPRDLTFFAVQALTAAADGKSLPAPPPLERPVAHAAEYVGTYSAGGRSFTVGGTASGLTLTSNGRGAALESVGGDMFRTLHPDFRKFTFLFDRSGGKAVSAAWGPDTFVRPGAAVRVPRSDPALARFTGTYVNDSPWWGTSVIVERGGQLWIGTETPLIQTGENSWRVGDERWSPDRASFANFVDGKPQTFVFSGVEFARQDV
jgi:CubicO group peptidase (beta-lactamase class C family)